MYPTGHSPKFTGISAGGKMNTMNTKTGRLVGMGILTALVIVLQTFASGFKIGTFSPPLALIPIILGAILFGEIGGAILGLIFGIVVVIAVISGAEAFSTLMLNYNPVMTIIVCLLKGAAAGYLSGIVYKALSKCGNIVSTVVAAITAPFVNTGIFSIAMFAIFYNILDNTAKSVGATNTVLFFFTAFIGVGFIFNLAFVGILVPALIRIIDIVKKK